MPSFPNASPAVISAPDSHLQPPSASEPAPLQAGFFQGDGRWVSAIFLLGTVWAAAYLYHGGFFHYNAFAEQADVAEHLAQGHGFLSPLDPSPNAPPTTWAGPIYPALMAVVYVLFGIKSATSLMLMMLLNAISFGVIAAGMFRLGHLTLNRQTGMVAAALLCAHPMFLRWTGYYWDTYLALAMFTWLTVAALQTGRGTMSKRAAIILGAMMAILSLTNATYGVALLVLLVLAMFNTPWRLRALRGAMLLGMFIFVMFPWTVRNYQRFGHVFFVRQGLGLELWVGNQPTVPGWAIDPDTHPTGSRSEREMALRLGENDYFSYCRLRFLDMYHRDPRAYWSRVARRIIYEFLSDPTMVEWYPLMNRGSMVDGMLISYVILHGVVAIGGLAGFWTAWRLRLRFSWQLLLTGLACTAPFLFTHVNDRYCLPLRLVLLVGMATLICAVATRVRKGVWPVISSAVGEYSALRKKV